MEQDIRRLTIWNRVWIALWVLLALLWVAGREMARISEASIRVRSSWDGQTLRFFSGQGGVVISYLQSHSDDRSVAARLPTPLFILDSGPVQVDPAMWKTLEWRGDDGTVSPGPPVGAPVRGLYTRLEWSR